MTIISKEDIEQAKCLVVAYHEAVLAGDAAAANDASTAYDRLVDTLNGGTNFGSYADESSPGPQIEAAVAAQDGHDPMWGQAGRFYVEVDGMPTVVVYEPAFIHGHVELHAVRLEHPFISETGYRSLFLHGDPAERFAGCSVREAVTAQIQALKREKGALVHPQKCDLALSELPFVKAGLRDLDATLPTIGDHVFLVQMKQVAVVVDVLPRNSVRGPLLRVARFASRKPKRNAVLSTIVHEEVERWHVEQVSPDRLKEIDCHGKYLTLGVIEAFEAMNQPEYC
ncbi:hypothetical protein [Trinickia mobilis]|uniref:hypothetical protein n=1 Tax=Trinickia mobilis TaxID=2816356 RepID=UPI001A8F45A6|nr:hypothetical protein [Trinickia mobilis]